MHRLLAPVLFASAVLPTAAIAADGDPQALASELQLSAIEAMTAGDWPAAEERARAALSLDGTVRTSQARLVLARALEQRGAVDEALSELDILLAMDLLPRHRAKAEEVKQRLTARNPTPVEPPPEDEPAKGLAPPPPEVARPLGIALAAGGAVPVVLGVTFIGFDVHFASQGIESGGWAILGGSLLGAGIALEVVGLSLILGAKSGTDATATRSLHWTPVAGLTVDEATGPRVQLGVVGTW